MEPVPEPAFTVDVAGETDAVGAGARVDVEAGGEADVEMAADGRAVVVASTVVSAEVVVPVTPPLDAAGDDSGPAAEVEVEVVEVIEVVEAVEEGSLEIGYDALLAAAEQVLDDVDGALARLQDGTYGRCEVCDDGIADERLAAEPTARTCERHLPLPHAS